jgi:hypothetical protein
MSARVEQIAESVASVDLKPTFVHAELNYIDLKMWGAGGEVVFADAIASRRTPGSSYSRDGRRVPAQPGEQE